MRPEDEEGQSSSQQCQQRRGQEASGTGAVAAEVELLHRDTGWRWQKRGWVTVYAL